jgi:hypothetical protein
MTKTLQLTRSGIYWRVKGKHHDFRALREALRELSPETRPAARDEHDLVLPVDALCARAREIHATKNDANKHSDLRGVALHVNRESGRERYEEA